MPLYETVFITRQDLGAAQVETMTTQFCDILTQAGGTILKNGAMGFAELCVPDQPCPQRSLYLD
jgi:ribosomal protein S6